ncbi:divergent CRAL/TRIO domain-containing protein [Boeremia exigua]|uniref:divergent CRAL/TRIO domain-containing protein n=1 Tax=Boeremia exigua TaxID=749465 RepID=UPI001E8EC412|nr:divergent CRAL/TRIO domain-containing protein [Boeremia exigua]KAH6639494.1 divergent CRAL/TRIO domain-containing protein [Boeremia exigua]
MSGMRAHLASRLRSSSLSAVPPPRQSSDYSVDLAKAAASILYRSPIPSKEGRPVFILNAAALPDTHDTDFDQLLPYVLARLPEEDDLLKGFEYEVIFFAGDGDGSVTSKKHRPGWGWFLQAYHVLSRAMRKRLQRLYIVHEKAWVRILTEIFSTIVSPKFRRKIYHASSLTQLALYIPIENLLIPPSTYLTDRRISDDIFAPYASGRRAFAARDPFPFTNKGTTRFPRVLRETTSFILMEENITSEGLFRIPAHSKLREVLKEAYDRGQKFIMWKDNGVSLPVPTYPEAEHQDEILAEIDARDAYSVFMAAAMIKAWYASLRQPVFPSESYRDLKRLFGNSQQIPDLDQLRDLFSPASEWSFLPAISREIVVRHLLPLLHEVASRQEQNKMTAENLAVCFAPALLCGPDQIEDAKMSSIIRRIFTHAVDMWGHGLREACGQEAATFKAQLELPSNMSEWDDPVEVSKGDDRDSIDEQMSGITLQDNEKAPEVYTDYTEATSSATRPPPLPPRSRIPSAKSSGDSVQRKPAPPLAVPPRYSTVISDAPEDVAESPITYAATTDGFSPRRNEFDQGQRATFPDEKKSGTAAKPPIPAPSSFEKDAKPATPAAPASAPAPQIILPKRKALTAAQVDNVEKSTDKQNDARRISEYGLDRFFPQGQALPGLTDLPGIDTSSDKRKWMSPTWHTRSETTSPSTSLSPTQLDHKPASATDTRRPSVPFANRAPQITGLARPVYPTPTTNTNVHPVTGRPSSKSTSLPVHASKPRTVSPGLLKRMPSLEQTNRPEPERLGPRKLNLKKASVEDLRKLFEDRAGTANVLVEVGRQRSLSVSPSIRE